MKFEEIVDRVLRDVYEKGEGFMYIDPARMYKREPWYTRFWKWLTKGTVKRV